MQQDDFDWLDQLDDADEVVDVPASAGTSIPQSEVRVHQQDTALPLPFSHAAVEFFWVACACTCPYLLIVSAYEF